MDLEAVRILQHAQWYLCALKYLGEPSFSSGDDEGIRLLIDHIGRALGRVDAEGRTLRPAVFN